MRWMCERTDDRTDGVHKARRAKLDREQKEREDARGWVRARTSMRQQGGRRRIRERARRGGFARARERERRETRNVVEGVSDARRKAANTRGRGTPGEV